eukprot:1364048-Amphidinium_carterae.1
MEVDIEDYETCKCGEDFQEGALFCDFCGRKRPESLPNRVSTLQAEVLLIRGQVGEMLNKVSEHQKIVRNAQVPQHLPPLCEKATPPDAQSANASRGALEDAEKRLNKRAQDLERVNNELRTRLPYVIDPALNEINKEREGGRPEILQQLFAEQRQLIKQLEESGISLAGVFAEAQAAAAARAERDGRTSVSDDGSSDMSQGASASRYHPGRRSSSSRSTARASDMSQGAPASRYRPGRR